MTLQFYMHLSILFFVILKLLSARKTDDRYATVYSEEVGMYCYLVRKKRSVKYGDQGDFEVDNKVFLLYMNSDVLCIKCIKLGLKGNVCLSIIFILKTWISIKFGTGSLQ